MPKLHICKRGNISNNFNLNQKSASMKSKIFTTFFVIFLFLGVSRAWSQSEVSSNPGIPYKVPSSVLYGTDMVIDDQSTQDQRGNCLAVAFNGWIYAGHIINVEGVYEWKIFISTDNGQNWATLVDQTIGTGWEVDKLDILVCGTSTADLKLFVARVYYNSSTTTSELKMSSYDANTGTGLATQRDDIVTNARFKDVSIASDYLFPAYGATGYTIGMGFTKNAAFSDTVKFVSFDNMGATQQTEQTIWYGGSFVRKISTAYGKSAFYNFGRYHIAYEILSTSSSDIGQIWTAHSTSEYNSAFTAPFRLDNLIASSADYCRNPSICCQFGNIDNASGNYTEVVLFDRAFNGDVTNFDVVGTYNLLASNTDSWSIFGLYATGADEFQPDVNFDPGYNNFLATYCDFTNQKLKYVVQHLDFPDPYNWILIADGYNYEFNLISPYPKVEINPVLLKVAHTWTAERASLQGETMFDAEYSVLGVPDGKTNLEIQTSVNPNPVKNNLNLVVTSPNSCHIKVTCYDALGKNSRLLFDQNIAKGRSTLSRDVSGLDEGLYFYTVEFSGSAVNGKFMIVR
jgi:hypothetical protein